MSVDYILNAETRDDVGKGASRRLRREGRIPAVLYGAHREPENLTLAHNEVKRQIQEESFFSHVLTIRIGDRAESAVVRDVQRHPFKPTVLHMDFLRVSETETIRVHVPLHFVNEDKCKGVRQQGGVISRHVIEVEVSCLPKHLPEYLEVDVLDLGMNESIHLSEIDLPEGVELVHFIQGNEDVTVVSVHYPQGAGRDEEEDGEEAEERTPE
ncbi:MAG: 50S ribosomal protein L25/general stress protein Ctc, partial [Candidatus Competibacterales bacterium]|nr:50S ribosomal protein L25/general stress protein Ctc [Candidatus Competibacterales bacterium]